MKNIYNEIKITQLKTTIGIPETHVSFYHNFNQNYLGFYIKITSICYIIQNGKIPVM